MARHKSRRDRRKQRVYAGRYDWATDSIQWIRLEGLYDQLAACTQFACGFVWALAQPIGYVCDACLAGLSSVDMRQVPFVNGNLVFPEGFKMLADTLNDLGV